MTIDMVLQSMLALLMPLLFSLLLIVPFALAGQPPQQTCHSQVQLPQASSQCSIWDQRQIAERARVLKTIDPAVKSHNKRRPRDTLLDALHAFDRYEETAGAEIDRFESLYKHTPERHKKVRRDRCCVGTSIDLPS
jgi:carnosine N-methyltransferase